MCDRCCTTVSNAVKFTDRGAVDVELSHDGQDLIMRVKDSDTRSFEELDAAIAAGPQGAVPQMLEQPFALWIFSLPGETDSAILAGDGTLRRGHAGCVDQPHGGDAVYLF